MNFSARSAASTLMVVRNHDDFDSLCNLLLCNDPTVVCVSTKQIWGVGYTVRDIERFCLALKENTVVNSIVIDPGLLPPYVVETSPVAAAARTINTVPVQPLLHFIEHNASLSTVVLESLGGVDDDRLPFVQQIVDTIIKNRSIQSFAAKFPIPLNILTPFVWSNQSLRRLAVQINDRNTSRQIIEDAVRSIASHPALEEISLRSLTTWRSASSLSPFLLSLQSHPTMSRLELAWSPSFTPDVGTLPAVCESSKKLKEVSLSNLEIDGTIWTQINDGLLASPHVTRFALSVCVLKKDATTLILTNSPSNNALQQHIRKLVVLRTSWWSATRPLAIPVDLANVLRCSQVRHVALDHCTLLPRNLMHFLDNLSNTGSDNSNTGTATALMHTIELSRMEPTMLEILSVYLPRIVRLRRLNIGILSSSGETTIAVPASFLSGLRRNGSLLSVRFISDYLSTASPATLRKRVRRYIQACTRRNRALPKALRTLFKTSHSNHAVAAGRSHNAAPMANRLPTLSLSAMQAPQMAPNNVLIGLLADSLQVVGQKGDGKRVACGPES